VNYEAFSRNEGLFKYRTTNNGVQGVKRRSFLQFTRGKHPGKAPRNASRAQVLDARAGLAVRGPQGCAQSGHDRKGHNDPAAGRWAHQL
jgi:hypothetical protein